MTPLPPQSEAERARTVEYVAVGRVVRPHGVRGTLLVEAISEMIHSLEPGVEVYLEGAEGPTLVEYLRAHRGRYLLALEACTDRDQAEQFRGAEVRLRGDRTQDLAEGEYFHWQILGLEVLTEDGETLGQVTRILETGANDVYVVEKPGEKELLLPAIDSVILDVDLNEERLKVRLIPGLRG